ncbi:uncharacterized protein N7473_012533 [Penicillium subrubescens]|uniref:uncharacterized protein n=1 Tax=Penicillium subrubescens TaxID=1316194 RepID=UPI002545745C|nr:uncharacterized protein N7473_012533 [Penicillium subrubescens]KAJ5875186.1 hypothetical protein N7473_012533 [Penicillium subrubescens]
MGGPDSQRNPRVTFQKRCRTLKEKAHQLSEICGAEVYLLIVHDRENYIYNSSYNPSWPPRDELLSFAKNSTGDALH